MGLLSELFRARGYAPTDLMRALWRRITGQRYYRAQFGEGRLLAKIYKDKGRRGFCVEVGAHDGSIGSNTLYFDRIGWNGLLVEVNPALIDSCRQYRPRFTTVHAAAVAPGTPPLVDFEVVENNTQHSALQLDELHRSRTVMVNGECRTRTIMVPAKTLGEILAENRAPVGLEFLTIDVEGYEWGVLQGFTAARWKPKIIILERNSEEADQRIMDYMRRNKYRYLCTTPKRSPTGNDWFVPVDDGWEEGLPANFRAYAAVHPGLTGVDLQSTRD